VLAAVTSVRAASDSFDSQSERLERRGEAIYRLTNESQTAAQAELLLRDASEFVLVKSPDDAGDNSRNEYIIQQNILQLRLLMDKTSCRGLGLALKIVPIRIAVENVAYQCGYRFVGGECFRTQTGSPFLEYGGQLSMNSKVNFAFSDIRKILTAELEANPGLFITRPNTSFTAVVCDQSTCAHVCDHLAIFSKEVALCDMLDNAIKVCVDKSLPRSDFKQLSRLLRDALFAYEHPRLSVSLESIDQGCDECADNMMKFAQLNYLQYKMLADSIRRGIPNSEQDLKEKHRRLVTSFSVYYVGLVGNALKLLTPPTYSSVGSDLYRACRVKVSSELALWDLAMFIEGALEKESGAPERDRS
jgi:hypothetical protein